MLLHIPEVFSAADVAALQRKLVAAEWSDGGSTSGLQAAQLKRNRQLTANSSAGKELGELVSVALERHPLFVSAAIPKTVLPPLFNRYEDGGHYGNHVDNAIQRDPGSRTKIRTDVSITVFISSPSDYEGGELIVEDTYGTHEVKLPAGDAIIYPSTSLHRVEP